MPEELGERRYYEPSQRGYEGRLGEYLERVRVARKSGKHSAETPKNPADDAATRPPLASDNLPVR